MLAVRVAEAQEITVAALPLAPVVAANVAAVSAPAMVPSSGTLALRLAHGEVKIEGSPDRQKLETVLRWLMR
ncbi:hypothetical protein CE206_28695 (plasmid) [Achromobacter xylosoxidans]|uniref:hypothetical protein n=1 Tax=Alcaligenes xylosoxydans xylosoxydans TaxID=85698 RepID=UPI000DD1865D|nr:hypothetical protein [Achromobacter xylosoxidans]AXA80560.1 hypothetical protein CE206_28695 [Achromobacter xylosoxidans]